MKKLQAVVIVGLLIAVGTAWRNLHEIETNSPLAHATNSTSSPAAVSASQSVRPVAVKPAENFAAQVQEEAAAMSQLNDHPEEVQKRLKELADKMQESDVPSLQQNALNPNLNGDQRFLSVYILGESTLAKAQESLEAIATAPIPETHEGRLTTQEEIIRGQAVESIRQAETLKRVLARSDNTFINDRAQRNLLYLEGKASSPEQQDQAALTQLLKKNSR
ncbi:MAG: hypothetical protein JSU04_13280 [Bdellovibrionales bacterium]|nr:hypothetical protein [Bdellovibrionales bacterium]